MGRQQLWTCDRCDKQVVNEEAKDVWGTAKVVRQGEWWLCGDCRKDAGDLLNEFVNEEIGRNHD